MHRGQSLKWSIYIHCISLQTKGFKNKKHVNRSQEETNILFSKLRAKMTPCWYWCCNWYRWSCCCWYCQWCWWWILVPILKLKAKQIFGLLGLVCGQILLKTVKVCFMLFDLVKLGNTSVSSAFGNVLYIKLLNFKFKLTLCSFCVPFCQSALVAGGCRLKKSHHGN